MFVMELVPTTNFMEIQKIESMNSPFQKQRKGTRVSIREKIEKTLENINEFFVARTKERNVVEKKRGTRVFNP